MATKSAVNDKKRKATVVKAKSEDKPKKVRLDQMKKPKKVEAEEVEEDSFEDFSDSDSGGAKLDSGDSNGASNGKTIDRRKYFSGFWPVSEDLSRP